MNKIYLFRHGKTFANLEKLYCGWSESKLADNCKIDFPEVDVVLSSPLKRCTHYLEQINSSEKILTPLLKEINFGIFENKSFDEIEKLIPEKAKQFLSDYKNFTFPDGESLLTFHKRIKGFIKNILYDYIKNGKNILIISHEGVIKSILLSFLKLKLKSFWDIKIENNKFTIFDYFNDELATHFTLRGLNKEK